MVFNTGPYTDLPDNSILITANMQSETGFPSSHQLKSYVAYKCRLKLAAHAVLSADAGLLVLLVVRYIARHRVGASICRSIVTNAPNAEIDRPQILVQLKHIANRYTDEQLFV